MKINDLAECNIFDTFLLTKKLMLEFSFGRVIDRQQKCKNDVTSDKETNSSNNCKKVNSESSSGRDKAKATKQSEKDGEKNGAHHLENNTDRSATNGIKDSSDEEVYEDDTDIDEVSICQHAVVCY